MIASGALLAVMAGCGVLVDKKAYKAERAAEAAFPPEGEIIEVDGVEIHAVILGSGPDLVLIHGASGNTRDFTFAFADQMADRYRVIILDRPGFGWSSALPAHQDTLIDQAKYLQAAAAKLGADQPVVLGHSYGGAVALAWAAAHPDTVAGVVPLAAVSMPWEGPVSRFYRVTGTIVGGATVVPALTAFVSEDFVKNAVDTVFEPQSPPAGYLDHVGSGLSLRRQTLRINAQQRRRLKNEIRALVPLYPSVKVPVELVHGDNDLTVPLAVHAARLKDILPDANLTIMEGVGHMPHHVDPDTVAAAIDRVAVRAGLR